MFKSNRSVTFFALIALLACGVAPSRFAQQQTPSSTQTKQQNPSQQDQDAIVRISTQLVQVDAVVTDKKGNHIEDLTTDDFELFVDGKKQDLTHFKHVSLPPVKRELPSVKKSDAPPASPNMPSKKLEPREVRRTIAFIVDDLGLSFTSTERVRETLRQFLDRQMQEGDLVAIIRTGRGLGMLEQFTSDKRLLYSAIDKLMWNPLSRDMVPNFGSESSLGESEQSQQSASDQQALDSGMNNFRDTLFSTGTLGAINFVVNGLRELPGRKSVMLLSDGFRIYPTSSSMGDPDAVAQSEMVQQALKQLVEMANRSSVVIYSMDAKGLLPLVPGGETGGRPTGDSYAKAMQDNQETLEGPVSLAVQTGGIATFNNNDLNMGIQEALYDQQSYYLIGFDPEDEMFDRKLHKIKVTVKRPGLQVRARQGFYGYDDEPRDVEKSRGQQIFGAMLSPLGVRDLSLKMTPYYFNSAKEGSLVRALFHIDSSKLSFKDTGDGKKAIKLDLAAFAFDDKGTALDLNAKHVALTFDEAQYKQVMAEGLTYRADFPIKKPGAYQFRAVLRDIESKRLGTASEFINVPDLSKNRLAMSGLVLTLPKAEGDKTENEDVRTSPYVRSFAKSGWVQYGSAIYNATVDKKNNQPQLSVQAEIYRDGKLLKQLPPKPIELPAKASAKRFDFVGQMLLNNFQPGDYLLRVVVTDALAKKKVGQVEQWMDFTVR